MADLSERIRVLEGFLTRRASPEQRRLLFRMLVSTCRQWGDFEGAIFYGEEALRAYPSDGPILLELTAAHAEMEDSDLDEGILYAQRTMDALDAAAEAMGEGGEARLSTFAGSCLCDWGWMLFRQGKTEEARRLLERAIEKKKDPLVYRRLGRVRAAAGQLDEAKDAFAMALAMSSGRDSTALEALKEVVALQGGGETDVEAVVREKKKQVREQKVQIMTERTKIEPRAAPEFTVTTLTGGTVSLGDLRGSVVLLDFWATWCVPCRQELPVVQKVFEEFRDQSVFVIAASVDADTSKVRPFVKTNGITLPVAFARAAGREYGASSIPTLFLIDGEGTIRFMHSGYYPDLEEILPIQIEELLQDL